MLNLEAKNSHYLFDSHSMAVVKGDSESWKDSIGRTVRMWITYGRPDELAKALDSCITSNVWKDKTVLLRHPGHTETASRDHYSYFLIHWAMFDRDVLNFYVDLFPRMRGMNLWMKSLTGNKRAEWWYYFWAIPGAYIGNGFLRFCRWAGDISKEYENNYWIDDSWGFYDQTHGVLFQRTRTARQKLWAWIIFQVMPAYALHNKAWQIYIMRKTPKRDTLCKILIRRVGESNLMLRLLLGDKVTQEEIDAYPHMTGYRPGVYLDETCRRDIRELTAVESEFNSYEVELIKYLYNETKKFI